MVQAALGVVVEPHDDNSEPFMYDLSIRYRDASPGAVEVVAAADPDQIELWNVLHRDGRTVIPGLAGGWLVTVEAPTRGKTLLQDLPTLLGLLEAAGVREFEPGAGHAPPRATALAVANRIVRAWQGGTDFPGSVYFTFSEPAAFIPDANELVEWMGSFLSGPKTADVRKKLAASGASERHAFVLLPPFALAPEAAAETLFQTSPGLPTKAPLLPDVITHIWVTSTWSFGQGIRWAPNTGWTVFAKLQP